MILKSLKILSQNVHKNRLLTDTLLENKKDFNILFIQEPPWSIICSILSSISKEEEEIVDAPNHLLWTMFTRTSNTKNKHLRVFTYINIRLIRLCFLLRRDIFNHRNINLLSFFNHSFIINIYSDDCQSALKYLKDTEMNLNNILIITGDFNIRDNNWDPLYLHHSIHADTLREIADSFTLELSMSVDQASICYTDNSQDSNLVLYLVFSISM